MTETLTQRIERHEGFTQHPKSDAKGMYVIGFGHDITSGEADNYPEGITEDEAKELLNADIAKFEAEVGHYFPWTNRLTRTRLDVLVEMTFQMGLDDLLKFKNFLYDVKHGNYALAAQAMRNSLWHKQTPTRCEELADMMMNDNPDGEIPWLTKS